MTGGRWQSDELCGQRSFRGALTQCRQTPVGFQAQLSEALLRPSGKRGWRIAHGGQCLCASHQQVTVDQLSQLEVGHVTHKRLGLGKGHIGLRVTYQPVNLEQTGFCAGRLSGQRTRCNHRRGRWLLGSVDNSWGGLLALRWLRVASHCAAVQPPGQCQQHSRNKCSAKLILHHEPALSFAISHLPPERTSSRRLVLLMFRLSAR